GMDQPATLDSRLPRGLAVLGAALLGLGLVMWVAANWDDFGRAGRFALLQGAVLVTGLAAGRRAWGPAPGLLALVGIGALFAYFGQTYQTGADAWQLFALWALLALPLALVLRSDVLWAPWAVVAAAAISFWVQAHTGHRWRIEPGDLAVQLLGFALLALLWLGLGPLARRRTGAGAWAMRTALLLSVLSVLGVALGGLFARHVGPQYGAGLVLLALIAAVLVGLAAFFDLFSLSVVALALDVLLVCGLARLLLDDRHGGGDPIGEMLLIGLVAAGLLAGSVSGLMALAKRRAQP
uniref:DUF2157 domain-containing protein n=1 Tax=Pelomonas sp. KK5 TaxID=1855730 RepID=UPI001180D9A7